MEAKDFAIRCDYLDCLKSFDKPPLLAGFEIGGRTVGLHFCGNLCCTLTDLLLKKEYDLEQHWKDKGWHAHIKCEKRVPSNWVEVADRMFSSPLSLEKNA